MFEALCDVMGGRNLWKLVVFILTQMQKKEKLIVTCSINYTIHLKGDELIVEKSLVCSFKISSAFSTN